MACNARLHSRTAPRYGSGMNKPMVIIAGDYKVDADRRDDVVAAFRDLVSRARAVDGCIHVAITADSVDPDRINNAEVWRDAEALEAWRAVANAPEMDVEMRDVRVVRYDATDGGPLFLRTAVGRSSVECVPSGSLQPLVIVAGCSRVR